MPRKQEKSKGKHKNGKMCWASCTNFDDRDVNKQQIMVLCVWYTVGVTLCLPNLQRTKGERDGKREKTMQELQLTLRVLREEARTVRERTCLYQFAASREGYSQHYIRITYGEECVTACVGGERKHAAALFTALVQGLVTPCTVGDILHDLGFAWNSG